MFSWLASTPTIIQPGCQARFNISTDSSLWRDPAGNAISFNNCSHLQQHHPTTATFPAVQTPFKINLSSKNIISCKMNHEPFFRPSLSLSVFLPPPPSNNLFKLPNSEQWSNLLPREDLRIQILFEKRRKKRVYIPGCLLTNKGLIWNVPLVACGSLKFAWFEYSVKNIIWLRGVSRCRVYFRARQASVGQHMSLTTLKPKLTPFRTSPNPPRQRGRHTSWWTAGLIPPRRSSPAIRSVFVSAQSPVGFLH